MGRGPLLLMRVAIVALLLASIAAMTSGHPTSVTGRAATAVSDRHIRVLARAAARTRRLVAEHRRRDGEGSVQAAVRHRDLQSLAARAGARLAAAEARRRRPSD